MHKFYTLLQIVPKIHILQASIPIEYIELSELQINSDIERCIVSVLFHIILEKRKEKCSFFRIFKTYVCIVPLFLFMIHGCNTSCV